MTFQDKLRQTAQFLRTNGLYKLVTPVVSMSSGVASATLTDKAINNVEVANAPSVALTLPEATPGLARDLFIRLQVSGLPPSSVSFTPALTIDIGSSSLTAWTTGINLILLTEIADNHWIASVRR